ncbi:hypothetical protein [Natronorubrum halalkaliphilum]|uniref:hypothetical protein n=1 Tax=Natronorubrum halalkaliphilum TaxID=2691917 RepID=UPI0019161792|nr:hypothetical protein [Natronorubrum halalkaliphilum]
MCTLFTDDDVGKPVENAGGDEVGIVATVDGDVARVRPASGVVDSIKSSIGWDSVAEETQPLASDSVREITEDAVRLEGEFPTSDDDSSAVEGATSDPALESTADDEDTPQTEPAGGSAGLEETEGADDRREEPDEERLEMTDTESIDEPARDRGLEVDPTELARNEAGTRTDAAVEPDDDRQPTDAAVELDGEPRRTDAAVDPGEQPRRTGAEVDPDDLRGEAPVGSGPTTEDAERTDLEGGPEQERRTDLEGADADRDRNRDRDRDRERDQNLASEDGSEDRDGDADPGADADRNPDVDG